MATKFVRVKDPNTKHEHTVTEEFAKAYKLPIIDKPAIDDNGRPLAGKPHVELDKADGNDVSSDGTTPPPADPSADPPSTSTDSAKATTTKSGGTAR
jgi:hypothetical protein